MKVIQVNLNHCEAAQDLLKQTVLEIKADLAIISEPYKIPSRSDWVADMTQKSAIWACGSHPFQKADPVDVRKGLVWVLIKSCHICSCYAPPSWTIQEFQEFLDHIVETASGRHPVIIAGDFNAWAVEWGSRRTNARGAALLETFASLDLVIANDGRTATFQKDNKESIIDITLTSSSLARCVRWKVSDHYTHSDHQALVMDILIEKQDKNYICSSKTLHQAWKLTTLDKPLLKFVLNEIIKREQEEESATKAAIRLAQNIEIACEASMARKVKGCRRKQVHWWNDTIKELRAKCFRERRICQRQRNTAEHQIRLANFRDLRKQLKKEIRRSKTASFNQLCDEADENIWGNAYRVVMSKIAKAPQVKCPNLLINIVRTLFPHRKTDNMSYVSAVRNDIDDVTAEEVVQAAKMIGDRKASGPDCIPNIALKTAILNNPQIFVRVMQLCLEQGVFPNLWKRQRLVLLPKPGKPPGIPGSYRPLCLLDTMGKLLERLINNRIQPYTECESGLSPCQYGFRKRRSTTAAIQKVVTIATDAIAGKRWRGGDKQYCAVVTLDVKNAFNSADWGHLLTALKKLAVPAYIYNIVRNYLSNRVLEYDTEDGIKKYEVTAGVPQGSVLGPTLWNIMYDEVFRLPFPTDVHIIGFADDIALVIVAKLVSEIESKANAAIATVINWLNSVGLSIAAEKTEAVLISSRKKPEIASFSIGSHEFKSSRQLKYLGIIIDDRLSFGPHAKYITLKASRMFGALSRMLPNVGGPRSSKRRLLTSVITCTLLYVAPVWAKSMEIKAYRRPYEALYRLCALRVISAYRTTSDEAAMVIAGMMPIDILAEERARVYVQKEQGHTNISAIVKREKAASLLKWQERWEKSTKGRWTYRLIPNIGKWLNRSYGELNFQLTQFLTGHGCYQMYLHRLRIRESPLCPVCHEDEDARHVLFVCPRFAPIRSDLATLSEDPIVPENIVDIMISSKFAWDKISSAISVMQNALKHADVYVSSGS